MGPCRMRHVIRHLSLDESTWAGFRSTVQRTRVSTVNTDSLVNMKIGLCSNPNANGMGQNRFLLGHLNAAKSNDLIFYHLVFGGSYQSRYHHTQRFGNWDGLNPGVSEFHRARLPFQAVQKTAADSSLEKGEDEEGEDAAIGGAPGTCHGSDLGTYTKWWLITTPTRVSPHTSKTCFLGQLAIV